MTLLVAAILPALANGPAAADTVKLEVPKVEYRTNQASASTSPWIDANGWRILRAPDRRYYYEVRPASAALAAAEAFVYGAHAEISTGTAGIEIFNRMLAFLRDLTDPDLPAMANIGVIDNGSDDMGELMNMLSRRNLLYKIVPAPDPHLDLNVRPGMKGLDSTPDPNTQAQIIRGWLTDEKRLLRVYGSEVVIARLMGTSDRLRIHLLNYSDRPVTALRVRVLGSFPNAQIAAFDKPDLKIQDLTIADGVTEFTVPEMGSYALVDLSKRP